MLLQHKCCRSSKADFPFNSNFAKAVKKHAEDGFKDVSLEQYIERLNAWKNGLNALNDGFEGATSDKYNSRTDTTGTNCDVDITPSASDMTIEYMLFTDE